MLLKYKVNRLTPYPGCNLGGGGGDTTTVQKADPWVGAQPYIYDIMAQSQNLYNTQGPIAPYSGPSVATMPDWLSNNILSGIGTTASQAPYVQQQMYGSLSQALNPQATPYSQVNAQQVQPGSVGTYYVNPNTNVQSQQVQPGAISYQRINPNTNVSAQQITPGSVGYQRVSPDTNVSSQQVTAQNVRPGMTVNPWQIGTTPQAQAQQINPGAFNVGAPTISGAMTGWAGIQGSGIDPNQAINNVLYGNGMSPYLDAMASDIVNRTQQAWGDTSRGMYEQLQEGILPQISDEFQAAGSLGASRQALLEGQAIGKTNEALAREYGDLSSNLQGTLANLYGGVYEGAQGRSASLASQLAGLGSGERTAQANLIQQALLANAGFGQEANLANQGTILQAALANQGTGMQGALANQGAALQAALANQGVDLQALLANQGVGMQAQGMNLDALMQSALANQQAGLQAGGMNQSAALQAALANQATGLQGQLANQQAGLTAGGMNLDAMMQAQQLNQASALQAALANQGVDLQALLANQQAGLTAGGMNLDAMMQAQQLNQASALQAALANQATGLQGQLANQDMFMGAQGLNLDAYMKAALANQGTNLQSQLANQTAGLDAAKQDYLNMMAQMQAGQMLPSISQYPMALSQSMLGAYAPILSEQQSLYDLYRNNYYQSMMAPYEALQRYAGITSPSAGYGGTSSSTADSYGGSPLTGALGGAAAGYALGGSSLASTLGWSNPYTAIIGAVLGGLLA